MLKNLLILLVSSFFIYSNACAANYICLYLNSDPVELPHPDPDALLCLQDNSYISLDQLFLELSEHIEQTNESEYKEKKR